MRGNIYSGPLEVVVTVIEPVVETLDGEAIGKNEIQLIGDQSQ